MMQIHRMWLLVVTAVLVFSAPVSAKKEKVKQVIISEVTRVEGKIQKPEVWYLLPRSNLNFEGLKLEQNLVPKIEESTKKAPF